MTRTTPFLAALMISLATAAQGQTAPRMVSGRVFDDSTGCPLSGVRVTPTEGSSVRAATDANGRYRMVNPPAATFTLQAVLRGYSPQSAPNVTVTDSTERVDFSLFRQVTDSTTGTVYPKKVCRLEPRDSL